MKDIIFTVRRQKTELIFLAASFVIANLFNLYAIVEYGSPMKELLTSLLYVLVFTVVIYLLSVVIRLLFYGVRRLFSR